MQVPIDVLCSSAGTLVPKMAVVLPVGVLHHRNNLSPGCLWDHSATEATYST